MNDSNCIHVTAVLALAVLCTTYVKASSPSLVSMDFTDCEQVSTIEVFRILEIELRSIANGRENVRMKPAAVQVRCDGHNVHLEIDNGTKKTTKTIVTTNGPDTEDPERLIALSAAELVLLTWVDIQTQSAPPKPRTSTPPPTESPPKKPTEPSDDTAAENRNRFASVELGALWEFFFESPTHLFGGTLALRLRPKPPLTLRAAAGLEGGHAARTLGDVTTFAANGAAFIGLEKVFLHLSLIGEAGMRAGYARIKGIPNSGTTTGEVLSGSYGGPLLSFGLRSKTAPSFGLSLEGGYVPWGVLGQVGVGGPVAVRGFHLGLTLGIGYP